MDYDEIINRVGYFRNRAGYSQRETSEMLGYNSQFMKTIESKKVQLKVSTLLEFCNVVGITIYDFFYIGTNFSENKKAFLDTFLALPENKKDVVIELMKNLK